MKRATAVLSPSYFAWLITCLNVCLNACDGHGAMPDAAAAQDASTIVYPQPGFCAREGDDAVRDVFCSDAPPEVGSLHELLALLELDPSGFDPNALDAQNMLDPERHVAVIGHSTALSGRLVSPINPRVILLGQSVLATFQRGVQRVELATRERTEGRLVFYLLTFAQACNDAREGCSPGALYTDAIERDWQSFVVEDDEQLKNTPADCRQCHQRGTAEPQLLMRELESPWTHFFFPAAAESMGPGENGSGLMRDYQIANGQERYAGVDFAMITALSVFNLEAIVGVDQPLLFDAPQIENERWPWTPDTGYAETIQDSPTWEAAYEAFKRGEQLALPYVELRATDPDKQAALSEAYRRYQDGELEAEDLPDLGDIFPDDPRVRARIGLETEPDATPEEALIQACGPCHNDVLDQSISRARFTIALGRLDRATIDRAIERIELPAGALGVMPPPEARQLTPEVRDRLLEYLRSDLEPEAIDPMLERAAELGMRGGGNTGDEPGLIAIQR
jgi:hypothetical protein